MELPYTVGLEHLARSISGTVAFWSEGETWPGDRELQRWPRCVKTRSTVQNVVWSSVANRFPPGIPSRSQSCWIEPGGRGLSEANRRACGSLEDSDWSFVFLHFAKCCLSYVSPPSQELAVFEETTRGQKGAQLNDWSVVWTCNGWAAFKAFSQQSSACFGLDQKL